jgi:hypothetical protein
MNDYENDTLHGYLVCAIWSSTGEEGESLDEQFGVDCIAPLSMIHARRDVCQMRKLADIIVPDWRDYWDNDRFGTDFWLTRNGHGAGFWDRYSEGPGKVIGDTLTMVSDTFGEVNLYVGDDGLVHLG